MLCLPSLHPGEQLAQGAVTAKDIPPSETNIIPAWKNNFIHFNVSDEIIHSQTSVEIHPTNYWACDYSSMLRFRLLHVDKRSAMGLLQYRISLPQKHILNLQRGCLSIFLNQQIVLILCTKHGRTTAFLCENFQNYWTTEIDVLDKQVFMRFELTVGFGVYSCIETTPQATELLSEGSCDKQKKPNLIYWLLSSSSSMQLQ